MGTGHDLQFKHDGTNSHLYNSTGDLYIRLGIDSNIDLSISYIKVSVGFI